MTKDILRVGIIGMGRMGITHYSIINTHPHVKIVAVADTTSLSISIMKKYLKGIQVYKDYKDLIKESKPDAILVCTPPNIHKEILLMAAENNIHVFVEKPYTVNYEDAKYLSKLFKDKELVNQVGYVNRFNDIFHYVKKLISNNMIGNIIRFKSEMHSATIIKKDENTGWRSTRESGGGVIYEMSSHAIDLINFFVGKPQKVIGTTASKIYSKNVEDIVSSTIIYDNGITGTIYTNWSDTSYRKPVNKIELFGDNGKIIADQHTLKLFLNNENKQFNYRKGWNTIYITDIFRNVPFYVRGNEFTRQLYHFVDMCIGKELSSICSFDDATNTHFVINEMYKQI